MKVCNKCKLMVPLSYFYKDARTYDGLHSHCKPCHKVFTQKYRTTEKGLSVSRQSVKKYRQTAGGIAARKKYWKSEKGIAQRKKNESTDKRKEYLIIDRLSEKGLARNALKRAVRRKEISKQPCVFCGSVERVHAHHEDYSKPLDVVWLCPQHHSDVHKKGLKCPI